MKPALTGYFFFTAVLAGSVALAAAGAGDVGGPGCTDSPNDAALGIRLA